MAQGEIGFIAPLTAAIERTKAALFRPFRIEVWFVVGFTAWVAWLGQHGSYGGGGKWDVEEMRHLPTPAFLLRGWLENLRDLLDHGVLLFGAVLLAGMILALIVLVVWLSSRMKFVFLENVLAGHAKVAEPWSRAGAAGWSLFWWRLAFGAAILAFFGTLAAMWWIRFAVPFLEGNPITLGPVIWLTLLSFPLMIVAAYTGCFLEHFVVPIMAKHGLSATAAWGRFLGLFRENPVPFVLFGLFLIPLWILVWAVVVGVVLLTCCTALLIAIVPYLWMVPMLPVYYTYRALGPEFLAQFGPEWDCR